MISKKLGLTLAAALLLIVSAAVIVGASGSQQVKVPQGAIVTSPNASAGVVDTGQPTTPDAPPPAPAQYKVLFSDDFATDSIAGYQALASAAGTWKVKEGRLQQRGDETGELSDYPAALLIKGTTFADNVLSTQVFPVAMPVGVVFRGGDAGYYRLTLLREQANNSPKAMLEKVVGNTVSAIATVPPSAYAGFKSNSWQTIEVTAKGSHITASVDGKQILDATDASYSEGWAGVWATADATTRFDNIRIQALSK